MPKFGSPFANEGKGTGSDSSERRGGLSSDEISSRLYPKPADIWRRDEPSTVAAKAQPAVEAMPAESVTVVEADQERSSPLAAVAAVGAGQGSPVADPAPLSTVSPSMQAETESSAPVAAPNVPAERLVSIISKNSVFDGNYVTDGDVRVEGEVKGDITCKGHVLICDGASVNAKIIATSVSVAGRLSGEVTCSERFEAQPTARITSEISTPRLVIQEGAVVDGQIKMGVQG